MALITAVAPRPATRTLTPVGNKAIDIDNEKVKRAQEYITQHTEEVKADFRAAQKHFSRKRAKKEYGFASYSLTVTKPVPVARRNDKSSVTGYFPSAGCEQHVTLRNMYRALCPKDMSVDFKGYQKSLDDCGSFVADMFTPVIVFTMNVQPFPDE